jgi:dynein heavy chain
VLKGTEKLIEILDDHIVKTQAMKGSSFVKPFESRIQNWEDKLFHMQKLITEWLNLQSTYIYLKPVFASDDISQQLPAEARR